MIKWAVVFNVFISDLDEDAEGRFIRSADDTKLARKAGVAADTLNGQKDFDALTE